MSKKVTLIDCRVGTAVKSVETNGSTVIELANDQLENAIGSGNDVVSFDVATTRQVEDGDKVTISPRRLSGQQQQLLSYLEDVVAFVQLRW